MNPVMVLLFGFYEDRVELDPAFVDTQCMSDDLRIRLHLRIDLELGSAIDSIE